MDQSPVSMVLDGISIGSARGKKPEALTASFVRELEQEDLDVILSPPELGVKTPFLMKLRHTHHAPAMLMAAGKQDAEIHLITGHSLSRLSLFRRDPAFKELLAYYKAQREEVFVDAQKRLAEMGIATLEELNERLETEPEKFTSRDLMEMMKLCFDRSVAPPKTVQQPASGGHAAPSVTVRVNFVAGQPQAQLTSASPAAGAPILEGVLINQDGEEL